MSSAACPESARLSFLRPPYSEFSPCAMEALGDVFSWRGTAIVWRIECDELQRQEYDWLHDRPSGLPLVVVLPAPDQVHRALLMLARVSALDPKVVIPSGPICSARRLQGLLRAPPKNPADGVTSYLTRRGFLKTRGVHTEVHRILELSQDVQSVTMLAKRMYTSRRTLGRHFSEAGIPVPSSWLQFGRLFRVCLQIQAEDTAIFRIAHRAKYPDGFTLSNQMSRILGVRPSVVRHLVGWEWLVESWISKEYKQAPG